MKISSNQTAVITNNYLLRSENALATSAKRLSSGLKVNHSSDNPAGYAISSKMKSQIESLKKAKNNSQEGLNALNIAESGMNEIQEMIKRMYQLSVKAANGTNSDADRQAMQDEIDQLKEEIDSIGKTTEYNSMNLLDGSFNARAYIQDYYVGNPINDKIVAEQNEEFIESENIDEGVYQIIAKPGEDAKVTTTDKDGTKKTEDYTASYNATTKELKLTSKTDPSKTMTFSAPNYATDGLKLDNMRLSIARKTEYVESTGIEGGLYSIVADEGEQVVVKKKNEDGTEETAYIFDRVIYNESTEMLTLENKANSNISMTFKVPYYNKEGINIEDIRFAGYGSLILQTGSNEGQTVDANIPKMSCAMMGLENLDVRTSNIANDDDVLAKKKTSDKDAKKEDEYGPHHGAEDAMNMCNKALDYVTRARSKIGAYSNRLESRIATLDASVEDLTGSYSTIMDTDMAEEMTEYSRLQVLEQAGVSMLAQANKFPQEALQLLQ